ncbi:hypothetical protein [Roseofilum capinflatum]|uniref:Uncharacterized protein n=1 Tax=Roseofilum capinflatum BLCC-M114 TaxID=3022440 RepID=A0ABT7BDE4_9CYAN|nr:hypothetical protein [Roseofilum capinflatum]MDJ1177207.1 hypothetical protein [Roseofilum capinflatum BLCC-M114]
MDSNNLNCYQSSPSPRSASTSHHGVHGVQGNPKHNPSHTRKLGQTVLEVSDLDPLSQLKSGKLLMVNKSRRNGLIVYKRYHAEFAGPGAAVGGNCDSDCHGFLPVGNLDLVSPENWEERRQAYLIRLQWIRFTHQFTDQTIPLNRAQKILQHFEAFFGAKTLSTIPDEALSLMVGVFPETIHEARLLS